MISCAFYFSCVSYHDSYSVRDLLNFITELLILNVCSCLHTFYTFLPQIYTFLTFVGDNYMEQYLPVILVISPQSYIRGSKSPSAEVKEVVYLGCSPIRERVRVRETETEIDREAGCV